MTGVLLDPTNRPARLVAETRHKNSRWIRSGHMADVVGLARSEPGAASADTLRKYQ